VAKRAPIPDGVREQVAERARDRCEYCRIAEADTFWGCQIDHVISLKHDGTNDIDNLAYACAPCNRAKGSEIGSIDGDRDQLIRFFDPRRDNWDEHFRLEGDAIVAQTAIGRVTAKILGFNTSDRRLERQLLQQEGRYPLR